MPDISSPNLSQVLIAVGVALILNVFFLNFLIPIMCDSYDKSITHRIYLDSKERIGMILDIAVLAEVIRKDKEGNKKILIYSENGNDLEWKGNLERIELALNKLEKRIIHQTEVKNQEILQVMETFDKKLLTTREDIQRLNDNITEMRELMKNNNKSL